MDDYTNEKFKPISPLGYVGYDLLYAIPVLGLILLIVFAITAKNKNVKNYALGHILSVVIGIVLLTVLSAIALAAGMSPEALEELFARYQ